MTRERELVLLHVLSSGCFVTVNVLWFFLPWEGLQFVIVVFPGHTHLLFLSLEGIKRLDTGYLVKATPPTDLTRYCLDFQCVFDKV